VISTATRVHWELFHEIGHPPSARARTYVVDHFLQECVEFRNTHFESHRSAWLERGGAALPALWDGDQLHQGAEAVLARLQTLTNIGRAP
jgi:hypothetical protein